MEEIFEEMIIGQRKRLHAAAKEILPSVTEDDLLQINDFSLLENHPFVRYEEGVLEGLLSARMAYLAEKSKIKCEVQENACF